MNNDNTDIDMNNVYDYVMSDTDTTQYASGIQTIKDWEQADGDESDDTSKDIPNTRLITTEEVTSNFAQDLDEAGLDDSNLALGLMFIASKAEKTISLWGWDTLEVPDYPTRLAALKIAMTAKWHLSEKAQGSDKAKRDIQYILR